ncbi:MAG: hypothetical protein WAM08_14190, partial [Candidatus Acidiferrales bacterium]
LCESGNFIIEVIVGVHHCVSSTVHCHLSLTDSPLRLSYFLFLEHDFIILFLGNPAFYQIVDSPVRRVSGPLNTVNNFVWIVRHGTGLFPEFSHKLGFPI